MKEITVGQDNKTKVIIDKYGYAKIGKTELTADEIQIIATISANERANYIVYAEDHIKYCESEINVKQNKKIIEG